MLGVAFEGDFWYEVVENPELSGEGGGVYVSGACGVLIGVGGVSTGCEIIGLACGGTVC